MSMKKFKLSILFIIVMGATVTVFAGNEDRAGEAGASQYPASSTTKAGRHDIAEILLSVALNTINKIYSIVFIFHTFLNMYYMSPGKA